MAGQCLWSDVLISGYSTIHFQNSTIYVPLPFCHNKEIYYDVWYHLKRLVHAYNMVYVTNMNMAMIRYNQLIFVLHKVFYVYFTIYDDYG